MTNYRVESSSGRAARKMRLALMGPAFIAAIGYIDPGNFATNIQAGASFGYQLLWVVVWANLMAMLIQILSAKLGIATGKNLAEQIRDHYPRPVVWFYWVQACLLYTSWTILLSAVPMVPQPITSVWLSMTGIWKSPTLSVAKTISTTRHARSTFLRP